MCAEYTEWENRKVPQVWGPAQCGAPKRATPTPIPPPPPTATDLVIDQQLHGVVARLQQHNLIGLSRHRVGEGGALARATRPGPQPHADGEGVELGQGLPHAGVHVVVADGDADLEGVRGAVGRGSWGGWTRRTQCGSVETDEGRVGWAGHTPGWGY